MELKEFIFSNLLGGIDKTMALGVRFRMLIGAMRQGTHLLQDHIEEPLPLGEMIRITNSRLLRRWWSLNLPSEPMDLPFCCHGRNDIENSTPAPGETRLAPGDNQGPPPDASDDWSTGSNNGQSSDGYRPESSAAAAKRTTSSRTTRSRNTTKKSRRTQPINWADVGESEPESASVPNRPVRTPGPWRPIVPSVPGRVGKDGQARRPSFVNTPGL